MTFQPKSDFLQVMVERGYLQDCTNLAGLDGALCAGVVPAYVGYDATARSLHVGHLLNIMMLRWLQRTGHKPITLMGGGTTKVGDPSLRSEERPLLTPAEIADNSAALRTVFAKYLSYGGGAADAIMLDNAEWLDGLNYLEFLRHIGRHFSVNRMLSFESVKARLDREQSLSFLEFNYMILQAYDFLELHRRHGCLLQMGGSDQWGNIVNGIELTRRVAGAEVFGLVSPLLTMSDGRKMGKTAGGAVWLNAEMLIDWDFSQFWRNVPDADVPRFLKLYTELSLEECDRLVRSDINQAKEMLAFEVTKLCRGEEAATNARDNARNMFRNPGTAPGATLTATASLLSAPARGNVPTLKLAPEDVPPEGISVLKLLVRSKLAKSGKEARRLIAEGGASLNDAPLTDAGLLLSADALRTPVKLSAGRKRHAIVGVPLRVEDSL